jgi:hypothetical protein
MFRGAAETFAVIVVRPNYVFGMNLPGEAGLSSAIPPSMRNNINEEMK